jgi:type I restriction-modification system DNA methylase subunit
MRPAIKAIQDIMRQDVGVDGDAQRISQLCWMFFLKIIDDQDQELELTKDSYRSPIPKKYQWRTWAADPEGITGDELLDFVNGDLFPTLKDLSASGKAESRRSVVRDVFEDAYNYMKSGQLMRQVIDRINEIDFNDLKERRHFGVSFVRHDNTLARPYVSHSQTDRVDIVLTNPPFGGREEDGIENNFPATFRSRETADLFLALIVRLLKVGGRAAVVLPDGTMFGEGVKTRLKEHLMQECNLHTIVRLPNSVFRPYASIGTNLLFFEKGEPTKEIWYWEHRVPEGQKAYNMTKPIRFEHLQGCIDWWGGPKRNGREEGPLAWKVTVEDVKARGYDLNIKNPRSINADQNDPGDLLIRLQSTELETVRLRNQLKAILSEALTR